MLDFKSIYEYLEKGDCSLAAHIICNSRILNFPRYKELKDYAYDLAHDENTPRNDVIDLLDEVLEKLMKDLIWANEYNERFNQNS